MAVNTPLLDLAWSKSNTGQLAASGSLSNAIHPLFARENFAADINYNAFTPVLRLLTRFLDTPQLRHYLFVTFFGTNQPTDIRDYKGRPLKAVHSDKKIDTITPDDVAAVHSRLLQVAKMIKFEVLETRVGNNALCFPILPDHSQTSELIRAGGCNSRIVLNQYWYNTLLNTPEPSRPPQSSLQDLFSVAMLLLHELGHAFDNAVNGCGPERFFQYSLVNEAGFEIEARLLGAIPCPKPSHEHVTMWQWPNRALVNGYGSRITCRGFDALPLVPKTWLLPEVYAISVFQDWFWDEMGKLLDLRALVPDPIAESIKDAISKGERTYVPRGVAEVFEKREQRTEAWVLTEEKLMVWSEAHQPTSKEDAELMERFGKGLAADLARFG